MLVRAGPRPSPFLLHAWLLEWWRHHGDEGELAVHVAYRDGRLVGALPLCVLPRRGLRVTSFIGGDPGLADMLLADDESVSTADALADRARGADQDLAEFSGLPADSRLIAGLGPSALTLIERAEAPVLDLSPGWDSVYTTKFSSKQRSHHRRRRRQLAQLGRIDVEVARTVDELKAALEDAFVLHDLRWQGRPDGSGFTTPAGVVKPRGSRGARAARSSTDRDAEGRRAGGRVPLLPRPRGPNIRPQDRLRSGVQPLFTRCRQHARRHRGRGRRRRD